MMRCKGCGKASTLSDCVQCSECGNGYCANKKCMYIYLKYFAEDGGQKPLCLSCNMTTNRSCFRCNTQTCQYIHLLKSELSSSEMDQMDDIGITEYHGFCCKCATLSAATCWCDNCCSVSHNK